MAQLLLGEDGRGFELARALEGYGVWRVWLGESAHAAFAPCLSSPSAWEAFMCSATSSFSPSSSSKGHAHLQLRVRALLFDKASVSLFLRSRAGTVSSLSTVNPTYLQLHEDDVYFSLEDVVASDGSATSDNQSQSKAPSRQALNQSKMNGRMYDRASGENALMKHRNDELPDLWYARFIEKHIKSNHHKFLLGDGESLKRTPEGMSSYLRHIDTHKRRRKVFKEDQVMAAGNSVDMAEDENLLPDIMFPSNCVPDSAISLPDTHEKNEKIDVYGVLDSLPHLISPSPAMIERFGIRPEYLRVEFGRRKYRGKRGQEASVKSLSQEQASQFSHKVVACTLASTGFDSGTEVLVDVLSRFLGSRITELGRTLKLLSDSYRKQCSSTELIKMFLKTAGFSSLSVLSDYVKDSSRVTSHQDQQQVRPFQSQHQGQILQTRQQQVQRMMQSQLNVFHPQNLVYHQHQLMQQQQQILQQQQQQQQIFQQQLRRHQMAAARNPSMMESDRPMVEVKTENMSDQQMDANILNRQQMQFRHQQMAIANANQNQSAQQFKQFNPVQPSQLQTQGSFNVRSQPVKVEGFQELMGGDSNPKHESDERGKLTSPSK